jgi:pimeloyl-ACP methyl ester carboxylesterase
VQISVGGHQIYAATGGREFDRNKPVIVFLHSSGFDHTVFALLSRWFAHRGYSVLVPDLPGHGHSSGEHLGSIGAMADWTIAFMAAAGAQKAALIGHSMGSLIALDTAARHPKKVTALALIGAAVTMPVSKKLLAAAAADDYAAIEMVTIWGKGRRAVLGGSLAPGTWMLGNAARTMERGRPGVLFKDLSACNDYRDGLGAAAKVKAPVTIVLGERDLMTPAKGGLELAAAIPNAKVTVLKEAGHMLMSERPDEVLHAIRDFAKV